MKAAIVGKPGVLTVEEVPEPSPGEYQAKCRILFGATCSGTDLHIINGRFPFGAKYPTILGHESVGEVVEVGPKVRHLKPGDLVTRVGTPPVGGLHVNWGGFAEFGIAGDRRAMVEDGLPREKWHAYRVNHVLPPGIDPAAATMVVTWRETLSYMTRMGVGAGARVLVIGSGGNAFAYAAHARNRGAAFVAMVGSAARGATAERFGIDAYVDYRDERALEALRGAAPEGFAFAIDAVGRVGQLDRVLPLVAPGGTVGIYGVDDQGKCTLTPQRARGTFTFFAGGYDEDETHDEVMSFMASGALDAGAWLDLAHAYPLDEIVQAFEAVERRRTIKALVKIARSF